MIRHADSLVLIWKLAELEARHAHVGEITVPHLFLGILKAVDIDVKRLAESWDADCRDSVERISGDIAVVGSVFGKSNIETTPIRRRLRQRLNKGTANEGDHPIRRSAESRNVFRAAESMDKTVRPAHLLVAILDAVVPEIAAVLSDSGVDAQLLNRNAKLASTAPIEESDEPVSRKKVRKTFLDSVGRDLTQLSREGKLEPIIGRKDEIRQLEHLRQRVKGQDEALTSISDAIRIAKSGLRNAAKPIGVFLLAGPTGSGKTEVAKAVAEFLFGDENKMVRFDMSEFMEEHAVSKLIGSPPGYIGHDEGGQLTERIRDNPYTVLLLDEIEKAHPKLFNIFLQIFDEGMLTDAKGRKCDFCETVIFLTSNLGAAEHPVRRVGFRNDDSNEATSTTVLEGIKKAFRPELVNRFSEIIVFRPLDRATVRAIVDKFVNRLNERLGKQGVTIKLDATAYEFLLREGFSESYGAREMERTIDRMLSKPLSNELLEGKVGSGATLLISSKAGALTFSPAS